MQEAGFVARMRMNCARRRNAWRLAVFFGVQNKITLIFAMIGIVLYTLSANDPVLKVCTSAENPGLNLGLKETVRDYMEPKFNEQPPTSSAFKCDSDSRINYACTTDAASRMRLLLTCSMALCVVKVITSRFSQNVGTGTGWLIGNGDRFRTSMSDQCRSYVICHPVLSPCHVARVSDLRSPNVIRVACQICGVMSDLRSVTVRLCAVHVTV